MKNTGWLLALTMTVAGAAHASDLSIGAVRGGDVLDLQFDPANPLTAFAAVRGSGVFKSSNGGVTWSADLLPTVTAHYPQRVLVSKNVPGMVLVCDSFLGGSSVWKSADAGATFAAAFAAQAQEEDCTALAEGAAAGTFYAAMLSNTNTGNAADAHGTVYKTTDSGVTWTAMGPDLSAFSISAILERPNGRILAGTRKYLGASGAGVGNVEGGLQYTDDGLTWTAAAGLPGVALRLAQSASGVPFAVIPDQTNSQTSIYVSADGATWTLDTAYPWSGCGDSCSDYAALAYHSASDTFFALVAEKIVQSSTGPTYSFSAAANKGAGLRTPIPLTITRHQTLAVKPDDTAWILEGDWQGGEGVFLTTNGGGNWRVSNDGINAQQIDVATKARAAGYRYAASGTGLLYFSDSGLGSFKTIYRGTQFNQNVIVAIAFDRQDPKRVAIALEDQTGGGQVPKLLRLDDAVASAGDPPPFSHTGWNTLAVPGTAPERVYALLVDGSNMLAGIAPANNGATGNYLFASATSGSSWTATNLSTVGGVRSLVQSESDPQTIYAGSGDDAGNTTANHANGIFKSTNHGATWTALNSNPTLAAEAPTRIVVDPADANRVWVLAKQVNAGGGNPYANDIWESTDGGATWANITPSGNDPSIDSTTRFDLSYSSTEGKLILATGGQFAGIMQTPGSASTAWEGAFLIYGDSRVLYNGSVGVGSGTGLFEITNLTGLGGGGGGGKKKGCGCYLGGDRNERVGIAGSAAVLALAFLAFRRRKHLAT